MARLLAATRAARQRMALVDGADGFAPEAVPAGDLRHLVWVRCRRTEEAFAVADILVRDGNYAAAVLDLRGCPERALRRTPSSVWHRLHRAAENGSVALLVQTTFPLVPAVPWRLILETPLALAGTEASRQALAERLCVQTERGRESVIESLAG